jgi:hypothetical protein
MLHSRSRSRVPRRRSDGFLADDPHCPNNPGFAERNESTESAVAGLPGLTRVDIGAKA